MNERKIRLSFHLGLGIGPSRMAPLLAWDIPWWVTVRSLSVQRYAKGRVQVQQGLKHGGRGAIEAGTLEAARVIYLQIGSEHQHGKPCSLPSVALFT